MCLFHQTNFSCCYFFCTFCKLSIQIFLCFNLRKFFATIPDRWIGSLSLSTICGNQSSLSPNTQRRLFGTSKKTPCTVVYAQATSGNVVVYVSSDFGPVSPAVSPVCLLLLYPPCKTHRFCRVNLNSGTIFVVYI